MDIDWTRVAEPQPDLYDTDVAFWRLGQLSASGPPRASEDVPTLFEGAVAVRPLEGPYREMEGMASAPPEDERIRLAERYVRRWPEAFHQFRALMHTFYPLVDTTGTYVQAGARGSISHSFESHLGTMCASIEDPVGLSQAFVHEMAHTKLRMLGIMVESARDLISNDPNDLYPSPILIGTLRPMTAVFHAEYSFIHVTQLDLMMLAAHPEEDLRNHILAMLERNVTRMEAGYEVIQDNIQVDSNGRLFVDGFMDWARRVIIEGRAILDNERPEWVS